MNARPISLAVAAAVALAAAPALALPGMPVAQFQAWAKGNSGLHGLSKQQTNQDSGQQYFSASFQAGSTAGTFQADLGSDNTVADESVSVKTDDESYDILKHPDTASAMLAAVYGTAVAGDFKSASQAGRYRLYGQTHDTALYRGKLYGYEATLFSVRLIPASKTGAEAQRLAGCVKTECGGD